MTRITNTTLPLVSLTRNTKNTPNPNILPITALTVAYHGSITAFLTKSWIEISNSSKYVISDCAGSDCGLRCRGVGKYKVKGFLKMCNV